MQASQNKDCGSWSLLIAFLIGFKSSSAVGQIGLWEQHP